MLQSAGVRKNEIAPACVTLRELFRGGLYSWNSLAYVDVCAATVRVVRACSMGTSVGYDRARNKVSGGPMAYPLAHCQLESRFQSDTFVSTLALGGTQL